VIFHVTDVSEVLAAYIIRVISVSGRSVNFYQVARRNILQGNHIQDTFHAFSDAFYECNLFLEAECQKNIDVYMYHSRCSKRY
jgi:hypothetical protein